MGIVGPRAKSFTAPMENPSNTASDGLVRRNFSILSNWASSSLGRTIAGELKPAAALGGDTDVASADITSLHSGRERTGTLGSALGWQGGGSRANIDSVRL